MRYWTLLSVFTILVIHGLVWPFLVAAMSPPMEEMQRMVKKLSQPAGMPRTASASNMQTGTTSSQASEADPFSLQDAVAFLSASRSLQKIIEYQKDTSEIVDSLSSKRQFFESNGEQADASLKYHQLLHVLLDKWLQRFPKQTLTLAEEILSKDEAREARFPRSLLHYAGSSFASLGEAALIWALRNSFDPSWPLSAWAKVLVHLQLYAIDFAHGMDLEQVRSGFPGVISNSLRDRIWAASVHESIKGLERRDLTRFPDAQLREAKKQYEQAQEEAGRIIADQKQEAKMLMMLTADWPSDHKNADRLASLAHNRSKVRPRRFKELLSDFKNAIDAFESKLRSREKEILEAERAEHPRVTSQEAESTPIHDHLD